MPKLNIENNMFGCTVPLVIKDRFFMVSKGQKADLFTVFAAEGKDLVIFEVIENAPEPNPLSEVTKTPDGVITATDRTTGKVIYQLKPGYRGSAIIGALRDKEVEVLINDEMIRAGDTTLAADQMQGEVGLVVGDDGSVTRGSSLPSSVSDLFHPLEDFGQRSSGKSK